jgi:hypothetical protein
MIVPLFPDLNEEKTPREMVYDRLPTSEMPPLNREIEFTASHQNPIGQAQTQAILDSVWLLALFLRQMNISFGLGQTNIDVEF